ncbi:MAG: polyribonucleotide nucleotidyltransferase [Myxococcales bacterium]|nr:polyribonucleotide nucleotidyltransferase [Myxococcales bacterium]
MNKVVVSEQVGGQSLALEAGQMAPQADGAVVLRFADTMLLCTVCSAEARAGADFFPLTVEYRERRAAAGLFAGGYKKRETRPSDIEVLGSRVIDRTIRPLFPDGFQNDVQVICQVLSAESDFDPSIFGVIGASAAILISPIPWDGPAGAVRIARVAGKLVAFPTETQRDKADLDIVVSIGPDALLMVEGEAQQVPESVLVDALTLAENTLRPLLNLQRQLAEKIGKPKQSFSLPPRDEQIVAALSLHKEALANAFRCRGKAERKQALSAVKKEACAQFADDAVRSNLAKEVWADFEHEVARDVILEGTRFDGRDYTTVRPLYSEVGLLPKAHGSAFFQRGETQALTTVVLGSQGDREAYETLFKEKKDRFYLHYNFPPFSTGETKALRGPGRREIGHGMLAQRALAAVFPDEEDFPYTVRVISDILSSNGSSSMATVCAATLGMLDAGVPLKEPVAGIAMGLIQHSGGFAVLTDILGDEDHLGDMDFKVCGTRNGITAVQMDMKVTGLTREVLVGALDQARQARLHILAHMQGVLPNHRNQLAANAPRIVTVQIDPSRIGELIGPGGKNIKEIQQNSGAKLDIAETGLVSISSVSQESADKAVAAVRAMFREASVGEIIDARVKNITDSVAFVELFPGTEGVLHISEWQEERTASMRDVTAPGETVRVQVLGVDRRGKIAVSRKAVLAGR